jgi:exopolysaccharide biosynthesis polyprenyl glycosylphosphotransferase
MGRAILHYVPRAVAALLLTECLLSFVVVYALRGIPGLDVDPSIGLTNAMSVSLGLAIGCATLVMAGQVGDAPLTRSHLLYTTIIGGVIALPTLHAVQAAFPEAALNQASILSIWAAWLAVIALFRAVLSTMADRGRPRHRVLMIGEPKRVEAVSLRLQKTARGQFEPLTFDPTRLSSDLLRQQAIDTIVVSGAMPAAAAKTLLDCKLRGIPVVGDQAFQEHYLGRIDLDTLTVDDIVLAEGFHDGLASRCIKRVADVAIAFLLLAITLPLMVLTAIAVKSDSPGPVLYRQQRVGRMGRSFTLYKFRSMTVDAEAGGPAWAQHADPRVTRVGAMIRATRIDELPQLANVIIGQMSLVGPRPERPHFVAQLTDAIPFYQERSYVKPGVTGWAQVNFPYGASVEDAREKLAYDLFYVKHRGFFLDLFILLATVRVVLFREGAR